MPICQAVQHAHQKGIVHRDLKPANILVTLVDGRPVPKVIDFGVAKATAGKLTEETMSTGIGAVVWTLEYMSPEQAGFANVDIDTRSDIYSLGVILYELLTGLRPIDSRRLKKAAIKEMIRIIREEEPSKPSTRLSTDESLPSLAALRHIEPRKLMALLRGDLDWVVMKCLEKQRDRRYETANGLARDIQRYLDGEAVEACPPSVSYRLGKFLKRNRGPVAAGAAIAVSLVLATGVSIWFEISEARQRAETEIQRAEAVKQAVIANANAVEAKKQQTRAESERDKSERIAGFMSETLEGAGTGVALGRDITMLKEMMDSAAQRIANGDLKKAPEAELRLRKTIGEIYTDLALFDQAMNMLGPTIGLARSLQPEDDPEVANVLSRQFWRYLRAQSQSGSHRQRG